MPNTGRPSRGCRECRVRRVKCDEAPSACRRCTSNRRACSGYPSESDLTFRNTFPRKLPRQEVTLAADPSVGDGVSLLSIPSPVSTDWHRQAINLFFHDYVINPRDSGIDFGHLQSLPELTSKESDSSALSEAVSAVALSNLAHRSSLQYLVPAGRQAYGKALRLLNTILSEDTDRCDDQTVATVLCLDLYEIISGERPVHMIWSYHVEVLEALLRARRNRQNDVSISKGLSYTAHSYLLGRNLCQGRQLSTEARLSPNENQKIPVIQLRELIYATCQTATNIKRVLSSTDIHIEFFDELSSLRESGNILNERMKTWEYETFRLYKYETLDTMQYWPPGIFTASKHAHKIHIYGSLTLGSMWNGYRTTRLYLLQHLTHIASYFNDINGATTEALTDLTSIARLVKESQALADDVCASVPYMLGEVNQQAVLQSARQNKPVGGFFLLWPLGSLLHLHILPPDRIDWVKNRLAYIRDTLGIQQAENVIGLADS